MQEFVHQPRRAIAQQWEKAASGNKLRILTPQIPLVDSRVKPDILGYFCKLLGKHAQTIERIAPGTHLNENMPCVNLKAIRRASRLLHLNHMPAKLCFDWIRYFSCIQRESRIFKRLDHAPSAKETEIAAGRATWPIGIRPGEFGKIVTGFGLGKNPINLGFGFGFIAGSRCFWQRNKGCAYGGILLVFVPMAFVISLNLRIGDQRERVGNGVGIKPDIRYAHFFVALNIRLLNLRIGNFDRTNDEGLELLRKQLAARILFGKKNKLLHSRVAVRAGIVEKLVIFGGIKCTISLEKFLLLYPLGGLCAVDVIDFSIGNGNAVFLNLLSKQGSRNHALPGLRNNLADVGIFIALRPGLLKVILDFGFKLLHRNVQTIHRTDIVTNSGKTPTAKISPPFKHHQADKSNRNNNHHRLNKSSTTHLSEH